METISWFFFDLLFLGYVEDSHSGESFQLPGDFSWSIYVEVSVQYLQVSVTPNWHYKLILKINSKENGSIF